MIERQLYITSEETLNQAVVPVYNSDEASFIKKPARCTGLWTSSWREQTQDSAWVEWCRWNDYGKPYNFNWHLLTPQEDAKLYVIDSLRDLNRLLRAYKWDQPKWREYGFSRTAIDFEKLAMEYDGIHLTENGNEETHLSYPEDLNSWDCESVLWFKWCFTGVQRIEVPQEE